jgi:hypothetical protein
MTRRWPFYKCNAGALSLAGKKKAPPPKKERKRLYMSVEITHAHYDQQALVGLHDVHLPGGWHP